MTVGVGERWWSRRLVRLVGAFADAGRLERGAACAREGRVRDLRVTPYEVTARVRGAEDEHQVALGIDAVDDDTWARITALLASRPVPRARLLAGDVPPEIELVFAEAGRPLFPMTADDLRFFCDCADWGEPCEHAAAALDALGAAFDDDPFLVLEWNGRGRDELLAVLRRLPPPDVPADDADGDGAPLDPGAFWTAPLGLAALRDRPAAPPAPPDLVLRVATPPPVKVRRRALTDVLAPAYDALAASAEQPE
ncbi:hypothetical protein [Actinomadura atramentaria]|uniref:SWIM zinc finger family protein n=1 Tax=Actinomadura atramentaria TaxID=1990 RepID=UPI00035C2100|nr:hypothetical protein [Actinomadura atramentaria]